MLLRVAGASLLVAVLGAARSGAAPSPQGAVVEMPTRSPAEAVREAIREDPDVAQAVQSNSSQLYLLKTVSLTNGTTADLDLPPEEYLPHGTPDRVREDGITIFSTPSNLSIPTSPAILTKDDSGRIPQENEASNILVQLVPVSFN